MLSLDVLRAIAIFLVLGDHQILNLGDGGIFHTVALKFRYFGRVGVDLFFVLSGFLIGGLLFSEIRKTGTLDIPRFLIRRAFKIWPGYFALIFTGIAVEAHAGHGLVGALREFLPNFFHLQNYFPPPEWYKHTWSLAVEEHFYLFLPMVLWFFLRGNEGTRIVSIRFLGFLFFLMALIFVWRCIHAVTVPFSFMTHYTPTHLRCDALLFGVALAYIRSAHPRHFQRVARHPIPLLGLCLAILFPMCRYTITDFPIYSFGYTFIYIAFGAMLVAFVGAEGRPCWLWSLIDSKVGRVMATVGTWSYSIYLWQFFGRTWTGEIQTACFSHFNTSIRYLATTATYLTFTILSGFVMNKLIETPALALRERLFRRKTVDPVGALPDLSASADAQPQV